MTGSDRRAARLRPLLWPCPAQRSLPPPPTRRWRAPSHDPRPRQVGQSSCRRARQGLPKRPLLHLLRRPRARRPNATPQHARELDRCPIMRAGRPRSWRARRAASAARSSRHLLLREVAPVASPAAALPAVRPWCSVQHTALVRARPPPHVLLQPRLTLSPRACGAAGGKRICSLALALCVVPPPRVQWLAPTRASRPRTRRRPSRAWTAAARAW